MLVVTAKTFGTYSIVLISIIVITKIINVGV